MLRLEVADLSHDVAAVVGHRLRVLRCLPMLDGSFGMLADQGSQALLLRVVDEVGKLLVDDGEFVAELTQASAGLAQLSLDRPRSHAAGVYGEA